MLELLKQGHAGGFGEQIKWSYYLIGYVFRYLLITTTSTIVCNSMTQTLQRRLLKLMGHEFEIKFRKGKENTMADSISIADLLTNITQVGMDIWEQIWETHKQAKSVHQIKEAAKFGHMVDESLLSPITRTLYSVSVFGHVCYVSLHIEPYHAESHFTGRPCPAILPLGMILSVPKEFLCHLKTKISGASPRCITESSCIV